MSKKLFIRTYGCQMNSYDSDRMADVLAPMGYSTCDAPEDADMVIVNTCHIREKASEKLYSDLGRLRAHKLQKEASGGRMLIGVAGCVAQADGEEILARAPYVDVVVGPQSYHQLPELVDSVLSGSKARIALDFEEEAKFDHLPETTQRNAVSAFVSIQEGCDKFCTFCVVPYTRGAEYSRKTAAVIDEVKRVVANGALEITLLGQNVNAYHGEAPDGSVWNLARLIEEVANVSGVQRIRYTTSHPRDMDESLIRAHADIDALMPFLHLPVQSGSDAILKAMNRRHTADFYLKVIDDLRKARSDISLSSDFIVGFPGESDADFDATMKLVEMVEFAQAYSFKYSMRPGTPAAEKLAQVDEKVKEERLAQLQDLLNRQQQAFNQRMLGTVQRVLLDAKGKRLGQCKGRTPYMQSAYVENAVHYHNRLVDVRIVGAYANSLRGEIVESQVTLAQGAHPDGEIRQEIHA